MCVYIISITLTVRREDLEVLIDHDPTVPPLFCKNSKHNACVVPRNRVPDQFPFPLRDL